jgi:hypothetical protein
VPNRQTHFRNVDLDLESATDLRDLVLALGSAVMPMYASRTGRRHSVRLQLSTQSKNPAQAITRFAKAVTGLTRKHRQLWNRTRVKEFDIGIQGGDEPQAMEWVLDPATVRVAASLGARIRITVYSPSSD